MSLISSSLLGGLNLSTAEKAFRPWWDNVEDHLVYALVLISLLAAPTSFLLGSSLDCNYCQGTQCQDWCISNSFNVYEDCKNSDQDNSAAAYNLLWVRQFCSKSVDTSETGLDSGHDTGLKISLFIAFFPYFLILVAALLVVIDRPFVMVLFKSYNIEQLYKLLVVNDPFTENLDRKKETNELLSILGSTSKYYLSYLLRTVLSIIASVIPLVIMSLELADDERNYKFFTNKAHICRVHGRFYECSGMPRDFYWGVGISFLVLLSLYLVINIWNLIWICVPSFSPFFTIMNKYKSMNGKTNLEKLYFNNRNVKLIMGLLSSASGVASPLRSLALMEKNLNDALLPKMQVHDTLDKHSNRPYTQLTFTIEEGSALEATIKLRSAYVSFCLEFGDSAINFHSFESSHEEIIWRAARSLLPLQLSSSVNGKIIATKKFEFIEV